MQPRPIAINHTDLIELVDSQRDQLVDFLQETVRAPSVTGEEDQAASIYEQVLSAIGLEVERQFVDVELVADQYNDAAKEPGLDKRHNLIGRLRSGGNQNALILNGHYDVVPTGPVELWTDDPFSGSIRNGRLYGRGSADMKAGLAAGIFAVKTLIESGLSVGRDLEIQCVIEETGGLGAITAARKSSAVDSAIVLEPTDCTVVLAQSGMLRFKIEFSGKPAHPAEPWEGVSAFDKLTSFYTKLREWDEERKKTQRHPLLENVPDQAPLVVTMARAGEGPGLVPASASITGRVGYLPGTSSRDLIDRIESLLQDFAEKDEWLTSHPPTTTWTFANMSSWETATNSLIAKTLTSASKKVLGSYEIRGMTGGSDASHLERLLKIPIAVFGPGTAGEGHKPDESVDLEEVVTATKVLAVAIAEYVHAED